MRVGLLAYGAIGDEHNRAVRTIADWDVSAVCDVNSERIAAALELAPQARAFTDAAQMLDSGLIDLVVVSTPPAFYMRPATLDDMVRHTIGRALDLFDLDLSGFPR